MTKKLILTVKLQKTNNLYSICSCLRKRIEYTVLARLGLSTVMHECKARYKNLWFVA